MNHWDPTTVDYSQVTQTMLLLSSSCMADSSIRSSVFVLSKIFTEHGSVRSSVSQGNARWVSECVGPCASLCWDDLAHDGVSGGPKCCTAKHQRSRATKLWILCLGDVLHCYVVWNPGGTADHGLARRKKLVAHGFRWIYSFHWSSARSQQNSEWGGRKFLCHCGGSRASGDDPVWTPRRTLVALARVCADALCSSAFAELVYVFLLTLYLHKWFSWPCSSSISSALDGTAQRGSSFDTASARLYRPSIALSPSSSWPS